MFLIVLFLSVLVSKVGGDYNTRFEMGEANLKLISWEEVYSHKWLILCRAIGDTLIICLVLFLARKKK